MTKARVDDSSSTASRNENGEFTDAEGRLRISYEAVKRLYPDHDLSVLAEAAKGGVTPPYSSGAEGIQEYTSYVVKGSSPFIGLIGIDWELLRTWVAQRNWGALARHLGEEVPKHTAKVDVKEVVKLNLWEIAVTLATSAIACIFWQRW